MGIRPTGKPFSADATTIVQRIDFDAAAGSEVAVDDGADLVVITNATSTKTVLLPEATAAMEGRLIYVVTHSAECVVSDGTSNWGIYTGDLGVAACTLADDTPTWTLHLIDAASGVG